MIQKIDFVYYRKVCRKAEQSDVSIRNKCTEMTIESEFTPPRKENSQLTEFVKHYKYTSNRVR